MSSTNLPAAWPTDRDALDRALAIVAEESFFAMLDPIRDDMPQVDGPMLSATVGFSGPFSGALSCRMSRDLAKELTTAFTGEETQDGGAVDDLAGEFANMVCGRWLTDIAPQSLFQVDRPVVVRAGPPSSAPSGLLNGQPIWVELTLKT